MLMIEPSADNVSTAKNLYAYALFVANMLDDLFQMFVMLLLI